MSWIYTKMLCMFSILIFTTVGCVSSQQLSDVFSENADYDFRKVKWGYSQERVALAEAGNTIYKRTDDYIIYKCKINGVYCQLIYTFKDNRLRTAGYVTITPLPNGDDLLKEAVNKHGVPETHGQYCGGLQEMIWKTPNKVIFANLYKTREKRTSVNYGYSGTGLIRDIVRNELPSGTAGVITYWDGTYAHVDPVFFKQLHEINLPLSDLSFYEKRLMGIVLRKGGTQIPGLGTIP